MSGRRGRMRIAFVLPGRGGGGGAHSVVQESLGLQKFGLEVVIATTPETFQDFRSTYPELEPAGVVMETYAETADLAAVIQGCDLAIATTAPSAHVLEAALQQMGETRPRSGYYIQDYEPFFFTPGSAEWLAARASYTVLSGEPLLFAKTAWLCSFVEDNHGRAVTKVAPSLDHGVYHPTLGERSGPAVITAMIRPRTPRRAPRRTLRVLERLAAELGDQVQTVSFGCGAEEFETVGLSPSSAVETRGVLNRGEVADLLRQSDLFLDLSDYQAFGRTGLEAMACGCVPVLPVFGGAGEYGRHGENAFLIDTRSDDLIVRTVREHLEGQEGARRARREAGLATSLDYSIERAVISEYSAFCRFLG